MPLATSKAYEVTRGPGPVLELGKDSERARGPASGRSMPGGLWWQKADKAQGADTNTLPPDGTEHRALRRGLE